MKIFLHLLGVLFLFIGIWMLWHSWTAQNELSPKPAMTLESDKSWVTIEELKRIGKNSDEAKNQK